MGRPTFSWCLIVKNEAKNVQRLCDSIEGTWDDLIVIDTGSTDDTVELFKARGAKVFHFDWINDFAAARNECLKYVTTDYWGWIDGDDILDGKEAFIKFRDEVMGQSQMWLATYHYAFNDKKQSVCAFSRERVLKNDKGFRWNYFCHEGVNAPQGTQASFIGSWSIHHQRTEEDLKQDKGRNLTLFLHHGEDNLDSRMLYYFGKELFEAGKIDDALRVFLKANQKPDLEVHDRILCTQYAAYCLFQKNEFIKTVDLCNTGLLMDPIRAEMWVLSADSYLKMGKVLESIPFYNAAKSCIRKDNGVSVIFNHKDAYGPYPRNQLARCYYQMQDFERATLEAKECVRLYPDNEEAKVILVEIENNVKKTLAFNDATPCEDIVISCPMNAYEWDEDIEKTRGVGGSEIAAIEMARYLRKHSGRKVIIFNAISEPKMFSSGVQYMPQSMMQDYFAQKKPALHIAWRHNFKLTNAKTYLWSHDLLTPHANQIDTYHKYLCLSEFHKKYVHAVTGIPLDKIEVTRNGIRPEIFGEIKPKNENKIIYVSSPDRGLEHAVSILQLVRLTRPDIELHCYYGLDNLKKGGMYHLVDKYEKLLKDNPWVKMHGNLQQKDLLAHYADAAIWLYPTNFHETFGISALETSQMGVLPIYRKFGALPETLSKVEGRIEVDLGVETLGEHMEWAKIVTKAIDEKAWNNVKTPPIDDVSWESVAKSWIKDFL